MRNTTITTIRWALTLVSLFFIENASGQSCSATCPAHHWEMEDCAPTSVLPGAAPEKSMMSNFTGTVQYPNGVVQYSRMLIYNPTTFQVVASANVCLGGNPFNISVPPGVYHVYYRPYQVGALPYEAKNVNLTSNLDTTLVLSSYSTPVYFNKVSFNKVAIFWDNNETFNIVAEKNPGQAIDKIYWFNELELINPAAGFTQAKLVLLDDGMGNDLVAGDGIFTSVPIKSNPAVPPFRQGNLGSYFLIFFQVDTGSGDTGYRYDGTSTRLGVVNPSATPWQPLEQVTGNIYVNDYLVNIVRPPGYNHQGDAQALYSVYPDSFDFINIFHANFPVGSSVTNFHFNVKNDVSGIGVPLLDNTAQYGSAGNLQGINVFPALSPEPPLNHEVLHQWCNFMPALFNSSAYGGHNGYSTIHGVHGGIVPPFTINSPTSVSFNQAVTFGYSSDQKTYGLTELYMMGAVDTNAIEDYLYNIYNPVYQGGNNYNVSSIDTIVPQDIVNAYGYRSPPPQAADTDFKTANIVISDAPLTDAAIAFYTYLARTWADEIPEPSYQSFEEAALSHATMQTRLPAICTTLSSPANGATNVPVTASLSWAAALSYPTGYKVRAGTTPGGSDILNNVNVGNVTNYDPPGDLPAGTTIYVQIIPYNAVGDTGGCPEHSFTTETIAPPACASLSSPANGAANVAVTAALTWTAASGSPSGYRLDVGTTPGGTDILNNFDAGNVLTYNPPGDFPYSTVIYVKVKPYNGAGSPSGCPEESFTTEACQVATYYADTDGDTYGDAASSIMNCGSPAGYVANSTDCNDNNAAIYPGATETCNGVDDDCDTQVDEGTLLTFYLDNDGDTYGNANMTTQACSAPSGYVANSTDCNDNAATINPGATETCNGVDDNCNGTTDEGCSGSALCGTYTIGGASPDFTTLQEAANALVANGVGCAVTFQIRNGTYTSGATLTAVAGSSAANTITFQSESGNPADVTVQDFQCFYLDNCNYISIRNMSLVGFGYAVRLEGSPEHISVTGNHFSGAGDTGIFSFGQGCPNLLVQGNTFDGMTNAMQLQDGNGAQGVQVIGNTISNVFGFGIYLDRHNGVTVKNNVISAAGATASYFAGIYVFLVGAGAEVSGNIVSPVNGAAFKSDYTTSLSVFNNFFHGTAASTPVVNLNLGFAGSNLFAYNTVYTTAAGSTAFSADQPGLTLKNNVFASVNGKAINLVKAPVSSDHNDLYTGAATLGTYLGTDYANLAAWQAATSQDANSLAVPVTYANGNPHSTQPLLGHEGTPVPGILLDIDGDPRHATQPDIGADEFTCPQLTFYADADGDSYGNPAVTTLACSAPLGFVANASDCNDTNAAIHPGATETCNGVDDDCSGSPESATTTWTGLGDGVNWSSGGNWSDGFAPLPCQDVVIPATGNVTIPSGFTARGKTLNVVTGAVLTTHPTGQVDIHN